MRLIDRVELACVACLVACSGGGGAPPSTTATPVVLPDMYDLTRVPARPAIVGGPASNAVPFVKDPKTGKYVRAPRGTAAAVDSTKPDTNDARTYYDAGVTSVDADPAGSAAAFYWASRINPAWAEPYFGRWYTLKNAAEKTAILRQTAKSKDPLVPDSTLKRLDSLVIQAEIRDPFFDEKVALEAASANTHGTLALANSLRNREIREYNREQMSDGEMPLMGVKDLTMEHTWYGAYEDRHFDSASADLAKLIKKHPDAIALYVYRSKAQYYLKQFDSAAATLNAAVGQIQKRDTTKLLPVYISKETLIYSIAMANAQAHRDSAAKANFQRTVTENLGFYMAHLHLGSQALNARDTATAINEAQIAAQIRPDDPVVQLFLGYSLVNAGHTSEGIDHLRAATTADPYYSLPYYYLAQALEQDHNDTAAVSAYRGYLAHAARTEALRKSAEEAIAMLTMQKSPATLTTH
jgi:tetratricopeptide (TPR) repeat protein